MKINLHIGAHKTASTYIQKSLEANLDRLNTSGVGFMPLLQFRRKYTDRLLDLKTDDLAFERLEADFFPRSLPKNRHGLIMSDENIAGSTVEFVQTGIPLHNIRYKLEIIKRLLAKFEVRIFLSIRSYESFFTSNYCESLLHSPQFVRFVDFRERIDLDKARWPHVLKPVVDLFGSENINLWRYEDFSDKDNLLLQDLAFGVEMTTGAITLAKNLYYRPSLSQLAMDVLAMVADRAGSVHAARAVKAIGDLFPKVDGVQAFDPWTNQEKERMKDLYDRDCDLLAPLITRSFEV